MADIYPVTIVDLEHLRGDTFQRSFNVGMDLTSGFAVVMQVRETEDSTKPLATLSTTNGMIVIGAFAAGKTELTMSLPASASQKWPEACVYDIEIQQGDYRRTIARGSMNVILDVTRL